MACIKGTFKKIMVSILDSSTLTGRTQLTKNVLETFLQRFILVLITLQIYIVLTFFQKSFLEVFITLWLNVTMQPSYNLDRTLGNCYGCLHKGK